jgi:hypothetical protein
MTCIHKSFFSMTEIKVVVIVACVNGTYRNLSVIVP